MFTPHLIICPSCKAQIADSSRVCPHCGHNFSVFTNQIIGLVIVALFVAIAITQLAPKETAAQPAPTAAPMVMKGNGKEVSPKLQLPAGLIVFHMQYSGQGNFAVTLLDGQANIYELLANVIGSFDGSKAVGIEKAGTYLFNVEASAPWTVTIERPQASAASPSAPLTLKGKGAQASSPIALKHGLAIFKLTHDGQQNFAVTLLNADGTLNSLLANKIGAFDSSMAMGIPVDGYYVVNVEADGNWTVSIGISATESPRT